MERPEAKASVGYEIADSTAKRRLLTVLGDEHLAAVPVVVTSIASGIARVPPGLKVLVHDLAPWTGFATRTLEALRRRLPDLPLLLYVPVRPAIAELLIDATRVRIVSAQLQLDGPEEIGRLRASVQALLDHLGTDVIMRRVGLGAALPPEADAFLRVVLRTLERGSVDAITVAGMAERLGTSRRALERKWRRLGLPSPHEVLDWAIVLYTSWTSRGRDQLPSAAAAHLGLDPRRVRRICVRLRALGEYTFEHTSSFEEVVSAFCLRLTEQRYASRGVLAPSGMRGSARSAATWGTGASRSARV